MKQVYVFGECANLWDARENVFNHLFLTQTALHN